MPILTVKEFAAATGKKPKDIHAYVSGKYVVKTKEGYIDTTDTKNNSFLLKHGLKKDQQEIDEIETGGIVSEQEPAKPKEPYFLDRLKGELLEVSILKGKIDLDKKQSEVFPVELVKELVMRQGKNLTESFRRTMESLLDQWALKYKIGREDIMKMVKELIESINEAQNEAIALTKKDMKAIAGEFAAKKGIGEHGSQS